MKLNFKMTLSLPLLGKLSLSEELYRDLIKTSPKKTFNSIDVACHLNIIIYWDINKHTQNGNHSYPKRSSLHNLMLLLYIHTLNIFQTAHQKLPKAQQRLNDEIVLPSFAYKNKQKKSGIGPKFSLKKSQWGHACVDTLNSSLMLQEFKLCHSSAEPIRLWLRVTDITRCHWDPGTPTLPPAGSGRFSLKSFCGS